MNEPITRFVTMPGDPKDDEYHMLIEAWKAAGLGPAVFLSDGVTVAEKTPDGLRAPEGAVQMSDEQFEQLIAAVREAS